MAQSTAEAQTDIKLVESKTKTKSSKTGDLIVDIATQVESLSKTKALHEADRLAQNIDTNSFEFGGVLKLINDNSWFEGFASFDDYVFEKFGFKSRKARYLIDIYTNLVTKLIPWDKVSGLGWTKLKDLAIVLTPENVDDWVAKASTLTVIELQAVLKAEAAGEGSETTVKTTDEVVKITFKLKQDQADVVNQALAKAKGELKTEYDTVAIEQICAGYVGGNTEIAGTTDIVALVNQIGFETALTLIADAFKQYDINVTEAKEAPVPA